MNTPYRCPICTGGDYYGRLVFEDESPGICPNPHFGSGGEKVEVQLVPSKGFVEKKRIGNINLSDRDGVRAMKGL